MTRHTGTTSGPGGAHAPRRPPGLTVLSSMAGSGKSMLARSFAVMRQHYGLPTRMYKPVAVTLTSTWTTRGEVDTSMMLAALASGVDDVAQVLSFRYRAGQLEELESGRSWPADLVSEDGVDFSALEPDALRCIRAACARQTADGAFLICEGAGAIGDLPEEWDLSNSALALAADRPVLFTVSARRGAALTSLVGNRQLMSRQLGALVAGFVLNNLATEAAGRRLAERIEQATGWPCLGVIPRIPLYDHLPDRGTDTANAASWQEELDIVAEFIRDHMTPPLRDLIGVADPAPDGSPGARTRDPSTVQ